MGDRNCRALSRQILLIVVVRRYRYKMDCNHITVLNSPDMFVSRWDATRGSIQFLESFCEFGSNNIAAKTVNKGTAFSYDWSRRGHNSRLHERVFGVAGQIRRSHDGATAEHEYLGVKVFDCMNLNVVLEIGKDLSRVSKASPYSRLVEPAN